MGVGSFDMASKEPLTDLHAIVTDEVEDIEAPALSRGRARNSSRVGLKTAILFTAAYGVYYLTATTVDWATRSAAATRGAIRSWSRSDASWAVDAFARPSAYRAQDLSGEKAEELFL